MFFLTSKDKVVRYDSLVLTPEEQAQARQNIGAAKANCVTPQMHGALGDGAADDTAAFKNAIAKCKTENMALFVPAGTYRLTDILDFDGIEIEGVSPGKCVFKMAGQATEREHFIRCSGKVMIKNITFRQSYGGAMFGMFDCTESVVENCVFQVDEGVDNNGYVDLYQGNCDIRFTNCRFLDYSKKDVGGVWVRNFQDTVSKNIIFDKCYFAHKSKDEIVAVWGWKGTVQDVTFRDCVLESLDETYFPTHMITLGLSGTTKNVTMDSCTIRNNYAAMHTIKSTASEGAVTENIQIRNCNIYVSGTAATGGLEIFGENLIFTDCNIVVQRKQYFSAAGNVFRRCKIDLSDSLFASRATVAEGCEILVRGVGTFARDDAIFKDCIIDFCNVEQTALFLHPLSGSEIRMIGCQWRNCAGFSANMLHCELTGFTLEFTNCKGITGNVYCQTEGFTLKAIGNELHSFNAWIGTNTKHIYNNFVNGAFLASGLE